MSAAEKAMDALIEKIMAKSKIEEHLPLSEKIIRKRVKQYIVYIMDALLKHHTQILTIRMWGGFSFDCTKAVKALGDLGPKRKYGYAWTTFQKNMGFLVVLDEGDSRRKRVSNCVINRKYHDHVDAYIKTIELTKIYTGYDRYFNQAQYDVPVDVENLKSILLSSCYLKRNPVMKPVSKKDKISIELLIYVAEQNNGCIPHYYECSSTGRLYGKGILNLQTLPKRIRYAAIPNCYVYDLQAGAISLLSVVAKHIEPNIETNVIDDYIANRSIRRKEIASDVFGVDFDGNLRNIIKEAFTAIGFGARIQTINQCGRKESELTFALDKIFRVNEWGNVKVKRFLENEYVSQFIAEFDEVKKIIVNEYWDSEHELDFVDGIKFERHDKDGKRKSRSKMLAHIYQSTERLALNEMRDCAGDALLLPMHDGIVTNEKLDMASLNAALRRVFGFDLLIDFEVVREGKIASAELIHAEIMRNEAELVRRNFENRRKSFSSMISLGGGVTIPGTNIKPTGDDYMDSMIQALNAREEANPASYIAASSWSC